jgi:hypothetical protein
MKVKKKVLPGWSIIHGSMQFFVLITNLISILTEYLHVKMKWAKNRYFGCGYTLHDLSNCQAKVLEARKVFYFVVLFEDYRMMYNSEWLEAFTT